MTEHATLVNDIKEAQKDPMVREKWHHYCAIFGDNLRDPSKHQAAFLSGFLQGLLTGLSSDCQIFVGGLPQGCPEQPIRDYFSRWGEITNVKLKENKGFCFVTFRSSETVNQIMANHDVHQIGGTHVDCKRKDPNSTGPKVGAAQAQYGAARVPVQRATQVIMPYMPSQFKPPQPGKSQAMRTQQPLSGAVMECDIFAGGLPPSITEEPVLAYFSQWGNVTKLELHEGKGFAFVSFDSPETVKQILLNHSAHQINGKQIDCKKRIFSPKPQTGQQGVPQQGLSQIMPQASAQFMPHATPQNIQNQMQSQMNMNEMREFPNPQPSQVFSDKIFVGGLPKSCREEQLLEAFMQYGNIAQIQVKQDKGFAFITFENPQSVEDILAQKESIQVGGKWVDCKIADNRPSKFLTYAN